MKLYNPVCFFVYSDMCNHNQFLEHFYHLKRNPVRSVAPHPVPEQLLTCFLRLPVPRLDLRMNGAMRRAVFWAGLSRSAQCCQGASQMCVRFRASPLVLAE